MKRFLAIFLCAVLLLIVGCETNKTRVAEGSVIGGVLGAAAGGIIGHQMGRGAEGVAIGAATGIIGGAAIGSQINKPGQAQQQQAAQSPNQLSLPQIADMAKQGVHENVIIDRIKLSNSKYNLTQQDVDYLKSQGVTQKVIDTMQGK